MPDRHRRRSSGRQAASSINQNWPNHPQSLLLSRCQTIVYIIARVPDCNYPRASIGDGLLFPELVSGWDCQGGFENHPFIIVVVQSVLQKMPRKRLPIKCRRTKVGGLSQNSQDQAADAVTWPALGTKRLHRMDGMPGAERDPVKRARDTKVPVSIDTTSSRLE